MDKRGGGGVSRFSVENFLYDSAEKFHGGTLLCCFRKFLVAKKFMDQRGGGKYQDCPSKFFCLAVPKTFVGEHFGVSENFGQRKILCIRKGGYQVSSSETFCHTVPKNFVREHLGVSESFVHRKLLCKRWGYH